MESEAEYRKRIQDLFNRIEQAFEDVDPDQADCEHILGAVTITLADRSKCILSAQPSVRQLWLALASQGTAYHFNYDEKTEMWKDDKGRDVELMSFLKSYFKKAIGIELEL
jgi:iron donor protein CyaY